MMNYAEILKDLNDDIQVDLKNLEGLMRRLEFAETFSKYAPDIMLAHVMGEVAIGKASLMAKVQEALNGGKKES